MNSQFDAELGAALLGFNEEAVLYCQGISDTVAQEYVRIPGQVIHRFRGESIHPFRTKSSTDSD